jgi:hypothetical protein
MPLLEESDLDLAGCDNLAIGGGLLGIRNRGRNERKGSLDGADTFACNLARRFQSRKYAVVDKG